MDAPHDDDTTKGAVMGISPGTTPAHVARALTESLCFQAEELHDVLARDLRLRSPLRVDGGVSRSAFFASIYLNSFPVTRLGFGCCGFLMFCLDPISSWKPLRR